MAAVNTAEALIFLHVPKSAGTTLNRLIEWEYPLFEMYSVDPVLSRWSRANLWQLPQRRLKNLRVFKGHMPFGLHEILPQAATYVTVIRDPVERVISAYHFMSNYVLHSIIGSSGEKVGRWRISRGFRQEKTCKPK